jgi:pSer/pThr/pTyr-binding forkhead associated (FHA) protein
MLERFANDCGGGSLLVAFTITGQKDWTHCEINGPFVIVGRDTACGIVLPHPDVSKRHVYIQMLGEEFYFADLASRSGIRRDGAAALTGLLLAGECIEIGPYTLQVSRVNAPTAPLDETPREGSVAASRIALDFVNHSRRVRSWTVKEGATLLGSARPSSIRLKHPAVSRLHCSIVRGTESWWVIDLGSRAGTILDGVRINYAPLAIGSELRVGNFLIRIEAPGDSDVGDDTTIIESGEEDALASTVLPAGTHSRSFDTDLDLAGSSHTVTEQFVVDLFREFAAFHERAVSQLQKSFREMLEVASQSRGLAHQAGEDVPSAPAGPAAEGGQAPGALDDTVDEALPPRDEPGRASASEIAEERQATRDLLAARLRVLESQLHGERLSITERLMRHFSFGR